MRTLLSATHLRDTRLFAVRGVTAASALSLLSSGHGGGATTTAENVALIARMIVKGISIAGIQLGEYPLSTHIYPTRSGDPMWDGW